MTRTTLSRPRPMRPAARTPTPRPRPTRLVLIAGVLAVLPDVVGYPGSDPDDRILAAAFESGLKLNPDVEAEDIEVAVRAGRVVLEGSVDTLRAKLAAEEVVGEAPGVIVLSNRIAVVPTERVQDAAIAEQIVKALHRDPNVRVEDVHVRVEEGSVTLSGIVRSPSARRAAQWAAEDTHGVTEIRNDTIVR